MYKKYIKKAVGVGVVNNRESTDILRTLLGKY